MKEDKLICTKCGKELSDDSLFCNYCGKKILKSQLKKKEELAQNLIEEIEVEDVSDEIDEFWDDELKDEYKDNTPITPVSENPLIAEIDNLNGVNKTKREKKENAHLGAIAGIVITFSLCLIAFACFYKYYLKNLVIETTKREVTVTDTGIADAVEKIYDAVVVVESYNKNRLYATGTGFVYKTDDKNGYILTNHHVIEGADTVKVVFSNNKREEVAIVGSDSYSDVAVLGVKKEHVLKVAEIGSSEDLRVGDTAFAVGAPLDASTYAWTTTRGIISGKNRTVEISSGGYNTTVMQVLQTDAAINSGNSGGPLCNSNGQVIGITNMKLASSTIEGMGFAIPIETAVKYADKFIGGEDIKYPYLGIIMYDKEADYRDPDSGGVYLESVEKGSPADKGGLKAGDKILKINGVDVASSSFFKYELYKYSVGEKITITVERDGKPKTLNITLGSQGMST